MAKRRDGSQKFSFTPDHKKLGIDPIYLFAEGMQYIIRKLSMRAITFLETASRSEVFSQSYGVPKLRESQLGTKNHLDVGSVDNHKIYYKG
jgi:hypothetical protein